MYWAEAISPEALKAPPYLEEKNLYGLRSNHEEQSSGQPNLKEGIKRSQSLKPK